MSSYLSNLGNSGNSGNTDVPQNYHPSRVVPDGPPSILRKGSNIRIAPNIQNNIKELLASITTDNRPKNPKKQLQVKRDVPNSSLWKKGKHLLSWLLGQKKPESCTSEKKNLAIFVPTLASPTLSPLSSNSSSTSVFSPLSSAMSSPLMPPTSPMSPILSVAIAIRALKLIPEDSKEFLLANNLLIEINQKLEIFEKNTRKISTLEKETKLKFNAIKRSEPARIAALKEKTERGLKIFDARLEQKWLDIGEKIEKLNEWKETPTHLESVRKPTEVEFEKLLEKVKNKDEKNELRSFYTTIKNALYLPEFYPIEAPVEAIFIHSKKSGSISYNSEEAASFTPSLYPIGAPVMSYDSYLVEKNDADKTPAIAEAPNGADGTSQLTETLTKEVNRDIGSTEYQEIKSLLKNITDEMNQAYEKSFKEKEELVKKPVQKGFEKLLDSIANEDEKEELRNLYEIIRNALEEDLSDNYPIYVIPKVESREYSSEYQEIKDQLKIIADEMNQTHALSLERGKLEELEKQKIALIQQRSFNFKKIKDTEISKLKETTYENFKNIQVSTLQVSSLIDEVDEDEKTKLEQILSKIENRINRVIKKITPDIQIEKYKLSIDEKIEKLNKLPKLSTEVEFEKLEDLFEIPTKSEFEILLDTVKDEHEINKLKVYYEIIINALYQPELYPIEIPVSDKAISSQEPAEQKEIDVQVDDKVGVLADAFTSLGRVPGRRERSNAVSDEGIAEIASSKKASPEYEEIRERLRIIADKMNQVYGESLKRKGALVEKPTQIGFEKLLESVANENEKEELRNLYEIITDIYREGIVTNYIKVIPKKGSVEYQKIKAQLETIADEVNQLHEITKKKRLPS